MSLLVLESPRQTRPSARQGWLFFLSAALFLAPALLGCTCQGRESGGEERRDPVTGLTPAEAKEVLVKVGERSITLGDYVATLLRMDRFERLRYQSEERQKQLLDEMIQVELLAQEARRRGLDSDPKVKLGIQQALRDELLRQVEAGLPPPEQFSEREVREYYHAHRDEFREPERRRVLLIRLGTEARGNEVLEDAKDASGQEWGELAREYSLERNNLGDLDAPELAGDSGFVSAPGDKRGENPAVPESVREAIFEVKEVGDVVPRLLSEGSFFYVARLGGVSPARDRTVADADRAIRVELRRRKFIAAEKELEEDLRRKYPVAIDSEAVRSYVPPPKSEPAADPSSVPGGSAPPPSPVEPAPTPKPAPSSQPAP